MSHLSKPNCCPFPQPAEADGGGGGVTCFGCWEYDPASGAVTWSAEMFRLLGLDPKHGVPDYAGCLTLFHPEDTAALEALVTRAIASGRDYALDLRRITPKGMMQWFHAAGRPVRDTSGRTVRLSGILLDITERKTREEAGYRRETDLHLALGAAGIGTFRCEWPFHRIVLSDIARQHLGLPPEGDLSLPQLYAKLHPGDRDPADDALMAALENQSGYDVECRVPTAEGGCRRLQSVGRGTYDAEGVPLRFDGVLFDITERRRADARLALSAAVSRDRSPDQIMQSAAEALGRALDADHCYGIFYDFDRGIGTVGPDYSAPGFPSLSGGYAVADFGFNHDPAFLAGQTQAVPDTLTLPYPVSNSHVCLRSVLRVPLTPGSAAAYLTITMAGRPRHWTPAEVTLAEAAAALIQTALTAAQARQRQASAAAAWQETLRPALPASVPGLTLALFLEPAGDGQFGGDFCDVFPLEFDPLEFDPHGPARYALVVGDVSGRGLAAAAQIGAVRSMLRVCLHQQADIQQADIPEALRGLNAVAYDHGVLDGFVTLFAGIYSAETGEIHYVSCGHESALHRSGGGQVTEFPATGLPVGVDRDAAWTEGFIQMQAGDSLLVHTDGLTEAGPDRKTLLGTGGVAALLSAHGGHPDPAAALADILAAVRAHAAQPGGSFQDDACALFLRRA